MDDLIENFDTINNLSEIVDANISPQELFSAINKGNDVYKEQSGGFLSLSDMLAFLLSTPLKVIKYLIVDLLWDQLNPKFTLNKKINKSGFWKFIIFAMKCGVFLCVFAIAGPIFMLIGITMIYGKLFKKMNDNPNESVIDFAYRKRDESQI
jgi:hypothetical protein